MILLASNSPRRRELLQWLNRPFRVCPAAIAERHVQKALPTEVAGDRFAFLVSSLAQEKAHAVAVTKAQPGDLVIGADTIVVCDQQVYGKPRNRKEAQKMLWALSGKTHLVYTGVAIFDAQEDCLCHFAEHAAVRFYPLDAFQKAQIEAYLDTDEPYDKAGAYAIQGRGALLIEALTGDYYTVMGLPIARLARCLDALSSQQRNE